MLFYKWWNGCLQGSIRVCTSVLFFMLMKNTQFTIFLNISGTWLSVSSAFCNDFFTTIHTNFIIFQILATFIRTLGNIKHQNIEWETFLFDRPNGIIPFCYYFSSKGKKYSNSLEHSFLTVGRNHFDSILQKIFLFLKSHLWFILSKNYQKIYALLSYFSYYNIYIKNFSLFHWRRSLILLGSLWLENKTWWIITRWKSKVSTASLSLLAFELSRCIFCYI